MQDQIFTIEQIAETLAVKREVLLRWMEYFEIRADKHKKLTKEQLDLLRMIRYLLQEKGYTMEGAKVIFQNKQTQLKEAVGIIEELNQLKSYLLKVRSSVQDI